MSTTKYNFLIGCIPDWMQESGVTVTAASEETALPDGNLTATDINKLWRSQGPSEISDNNIVIDLGTSRSVSSFSLVNHNAPSGSLIRLRGDGSAIGDNSTLNPNGSTVISGSWTGSYTDVDEGVDNASDVNDMPAGGSVGDSVRFDFANPGANLATGTDIQCFRIRARSNLSGAVTELGAKLFEGGTEKEDLGTFNVSSTSNVTWSVSWDASNLSDQTGASAQLQVTVTGGDASVDLLTIDWVYELDSASTDYDSGFVAMSNDPSSFGSIKLSDLGGRDVTETSSIFLTDGNGDISAVSKQHWRIDVRLFEVLDSTGYFQAGRLALGLTSPAELALNTGWTLGGDDLTKVQTSIGGQDWVTTGPYRRKFSAPLEYDFATALTDIYEPVIRRYGLGTGFLVALLPEESYASILSFWGTLDGSPEVRNRHQKTSSNMTANLRLKEIL